MTVTQLLLSLVFIYIAAKVGAEIATRLGQPPVLGELVGGIVIGTTGFKLIDPQAEIIHLLAELGVLILLFEVGLETKLSDLTKVGKQALFVAVIGVIVPILMGYGLGHLFGLGPVPSLLIGAGLSATSIGISARVLSDQGALTSVAGCIILGAAVLDDISGVALLAVVSKIAEIGTVNVTDVAIATGTSLGFVLVTLLLGKHIAHALLKLVSYLRSRGILLVSFLTFAFFLAYLAQIVGSAALIGAFAAGLLLEETEHQHTLETQLRPVADIFTPIFFVSVGASVNLFALSPFDPATRAMFGFAVLLTGIAVVSKLVAGFGANPKEASRMVVGVGMLARGEVGLIFAGVGLASGVLNPGLYAALVTAVMVTTLMAPPWLRHALSKSKSKSMSAVS
ncbi:High-affinity Na(+)/H(+) antiporter NhaS3 [compost metagenome]